HQLAIHPLHVLCPYTPLFRSTTRAWRSDTARGGMTWRSASSRLSAKQTAAPVRGRAPPLSIEAGLLRGAGEDFLGIGLGVGLGLDRKSHTSELQSRENLVCRL